MSPSTVDHPHRYPQTEPVSGLDQLWQPDWLPDQFRRLTSARVMLADYELLRADFPRLRSAYDVDIDAWLLSQAALISVEQAGQQVTNAPISVIGEEQQGWRPPRYGRSAIIQTTDGPGVLDIKGVGMRRGKKPKCRPYQTGLLEGYVALWEAQFQWMLDAIFERAAPALWTLPIYAILDTGVLTFPQHYKGLVPGAIIVRRAHQRPTNGEELPKPGSEEEFLKFEIEMLLRSYGITSTRGTQLEIRERNQQLQIVYNGYPIEYLDLAQMNEMLRRFGPPPARYDCLNIQLVENRQQLGIRAELVDFGQFEYRQHFDLGLVSLVGGAWLYWGASVRPHEPFFVQPHETLRLPPDDWSTEAMESRLVELSERFFSREISGAAIHDHLDSVICRAVQAWNGRGS